jgi:ATP-binding cassette, subfamily B (MDR/TAP), member 1
VATFIMTIFMTIGGFIVGFISGWEMSLVCTAALPVIAVATFLFAIVLQNSSNQTAKSYEKAGGFAE